MIGPETTIKGHLSGDEDLDVRGTIEGSIKLGRGLTIAAEATVNAEIQAQSVEIGGHVEGSVSAEEVIVVSAGAVVVGELTTPRLTIEDGARFKGRVNMEVDIPGLDTRSPSTRSPTRRR